MSNDLDNLSEGDAMTIINDSSNEFHERLHGGDSAVKTAVEKAFARANPDRDNMINEDRQAAAWTGAPGAELDPELQRLKGKYESHAGEQAGSEVAQAAHDNPLGEISATEIEVTENFRAEMGSGYDEFIQAGARGMQKLFPNQAQAAAAIRQSGILDDAEALAQGMRLLAKLGAKSRR